MSKAIISPSVLGYESNIEKHFKDIEKMIDAGIRHLHIDMMRDPFIPNRTAFSEEAIRKIYKRFYSNVNFDFHLMVQNPNSFICFFEDLIPESKRDSTIITIHRESHRYDFGEYNSKDYDWLEVMNRKPRLKQELLRADKTIRVLLECVLSSLKRKKFKTGLALEPVTSLKNITAELEEVIDNLLLMSVSSGAGGQSYNPDVTEKIRQARLCYPGMTIQVDGGLNEKTIPLVIGAGADNIVIGSYITGAEDVGARIKHIYKLINR